MPTYLSAHSKGGLKYQRAVPLDLQPVLGKKTFTRYVGTVPQREAEALARQYAAEDDKQIAALRKLTPAERKVLLQYGGLEKLKWHAPMLERVLRGYQAFARTPVSHEPEEPSTGPSRDINIPAFAAALGVSEGEAALMVLRMNTETRTVREPEIKAVRSILQKAGDPGTTYSDLVDLWAKVKQPRHERTTERYKMYFAHLVKAIGDVDPQQLTQRDLARFRDYVQNLPGVTEGAQIKYLDAVRAVFSVAVSEGKMIANPAKGVQVRRTRGKFVDQVKRKAFTGAQVKLILDKAKETRWSGEGDHVKPDDVLWALRLAAYQGMRIGEICQLRKEDVRIEHGVPILDIHDAHGSVKNAASMRKVPLHPKCRAFLTYAQRAKGDWVFAFTDYKEGGRSGWIVRRFPTFRREVCGIPASAMVTFHSFRHRFIDAMRDAGVPEDRRKALVGHSEKGAHGRYGDGPGLAILAAELAKVDPAA